MYLEDLESPAMETPKLKTSEFLDFHLKPLMQSGWSHILGSGDFVYKMKRLGKVPENSFLVTTDSVGLYPSIPHKGDFSIKKQIRGTNPSRFLLIIWLK